MDVLASTYTYHICLITLDVDVVVDPHLPPPVEGLAQVQGSQRILL